MPITTLPDLYLITPEPAAYPDDEAFLDGLAKALEAGIRLVQLRTKSMSEPAYARLAASALSLCREHDARLILNGPASEPLDVDGLHLTGARLIAATGRTLATDKLLGAACHTADDLRRAERIGADFVTLSPVLPTQTHPDAQPLGWKRFADMVRETSLPVFALGGMRRSDLSIAKGHGAHGIAAIGDFWPGPVHRAAE